MWQIILWSIGAFYALLIVPLLAYALCWFIREIPSFLKQRTSASTLTASKQNSTFNGIGTNAISPSNQQTTNSTLNQSPRPNAVNTPKRIHIQSITASASPSPLASPSIHAAPPLSPAVFTPNERIIRVQPSQSNLHGSIHPLDNTSPFPSFSKLPFLESSDSTGHSAQNSAPPSPPTLTQPVASIDMLLSGHDLSDDSDDQEIRALEDYFTRSTAATMSLDSVLALSKPGFNRVASSELHSRVVIPVLDSAPPTPDTNSLRQNPYSKEFESGSLPSSVAANVSASPRSHSMYTSSSPHISQAALLIAKRATTNQYKPVHSTAPFPFTTSAHADTPSNLSVRAVA